MSGFEPGTQAENEKLATMAAGAIEACGPRAMIAMPTGRDSFVEQYAAYVLASCWNRRNRWAAPGPEERREG